METSIVEKEIDALIKRGYYTNRAEFVEDAISAFFELRKEMKIAAVVELYKKEELSISKAAELAGLNIEEMKTVLADKGVECIVKGMIQKAELIEIIALLRNRDFYTFSEDDKEELFSYLE